jgi:hypothetical protein
MFLYKTSILLYFQDKLFKTLCCIVFALSQQAVIVESVSVYHPSLHSAVESLYDRTYLLLIINN